MSAFLAQLSSPQTTARDTGCVFPYGVGGRDVRVRLLTNDPDKAVACGQRLHEWGLPRVREVIVTPRNTGLAAMNPFGDEIKPIRFGGDVLVLETVEKENIVRFARWICEQNMKAERTKAAEKAKRAPSLADLADAGEIETIDAG